MHTKNEPFVDACHVLVDVLHVMLRRKELVQVRNGGLQLFSEQGLPLLALLLLDKVKADDR